jgi:hypothetical protein
MRQDIYWVCILKIQPSHFEDFKAVVRRPLR